MAIKCRNTDVSLSVTTKYSRYVTYLTTEDVLRATTANELHIYFSGRDLMSCISCCCLALLPTFTLRVILNTRKQTRAQSFFTLVITTAMGLKRLVFFELMITFAILYRLYEPKITLKTILLWC